MSECQHESTSERQGETWTDTQGQSHTVIFSLCANPFCRYYSHVVRCRQTGADTPQRYSMPPVIFKGAGKP